MKNTLLHEFSIDRENKKVNVEREFAAPVSKVWSAWTKSEVLDQWWAPRPWKAKTKIMDFREGGTWLYSMVGPEGKEHWAKEDYTSITPFKNFTAQDSFCDKDGNINDDLPRSYWKINFRESGDSTIVNIEVKHDNLSDLEKLVEMGFQEGFTAALENLDQLLARR